MKINKTKIHAFIGIIIVIGITVFLSVPLIKHIENPEKFRQWIESYGPFMPLAFILLTMIQIVVPIIPGEPFEMFAGYAFGPIKGTIICLIAGSIGSLIVILITRKFGSKIARDFFNDEDLNRLHFLRNRKAFGIYALIFMLPGTPKDLLVYLGSLADYDLVPLLIITTLGRIPAIITSTIPTAALGSKKYELGILAFVICCFICLIGLIIYKKILEKKKVM